MNQGECKLAGTDGAQGVCALFEDCAWLYAICREYLFHDHTEAIVQSLFPAGIDSGEVSLIEAGCGPGFYARRLAERFPSLQVLGIDRSSRLVSLARSRASSRRLQNCSFVQGDVERLSASFEAVDAVISSRLFLVVTNRAAVLDEMFRVLKPGGRLFLAEPTSNFKTQIPLSAMRLVQRFNRPSPRQRCSQHAHTLDSRDFEELVQSQPWSRVSIHMHGDYQCALCEKSREETPAPKQIPVKEFSPMAEYEGRELHAL